MKPPPCRPGLSYISFASIDYGYPKLSRHRMNTVQLAVRMNWSFYKNGTKTVPTPTFGRPASQVWEYAGFRCLMSSAWFRSKLAHHQWHLGNEDSRLPIADLLVPSWAWSGVDKTGCSVSESVYITLIILVHELTSMMFCGSAAEFLNSLQLVFIDSRPSIDLYKLVNITTPEDLHHDSLSNATFSRGWTLDALARLICLTCCVSWSHRFH